MTTSEIIEDMMRQYGYSCIHIFEYPYFDKTYSKSYDDHSLSINISISFSRIKINIFTNPIGKSSSKKWETNAKKLGDLKSLDEFLRAKNRASVIDDLLST